MPENIPAPQDLEALLGSEPARRWQTFRSLVEEKYEMEFLWNKGFGDWVYELKYRRGGKTLVTLYAKRGVFSVWIVLGRAEREKFDAAREAFSSAVQAVYDGTKSYHDGKWLAFDNAEEALFPDLIRLLALKRRPNRK